MRHFLNPLKLNIIKSFPLRVLLLTLTSLVFEPKYASAIDFSAGAGALEEGDDRGRGAAILHMGLANNWMSRAYVWGRSYGPVTETSGILSIGKRGDLFGTKSLRGSIGLSGMAEQTSIVYKDYPSENSTFTSTNIGLMLGINYDIISAKAFTLSFSWDSHLFAAGDAIIFLVTGRKQIIGLTAGVAL